MKIELPINGLTHHDLQGPGMREAYVAVAKGRQVVLIASAEEMLCGTIVAVEKEGDC